MTKTLEIEKLDMEINGRKLFVVWADEQREVMCERTIVDFMYDGYSFIFDRENPNYDDLNGTIIQYMEVASCVDYDDVYDVYRHIVEFSHGELLFTNRGGTHEKEYKRHGSAMNYAKKQGTSFIVES